MDPADRVPYPMRVAAALSWRFLAIAAAAAVIGFVLLQLLVVVVPVAVALLFTALLGPLVDWLDRRGVNRAAATTLVLLGGICLVGGGIAGVVYAFVDGLPDLRDQISDSIEDLREWLNDGPFGLDPIDLDDALDDAQEALQKNRDVITSGAISTASTVGTVVAGAVLTIFTLATFLYSGRNMWQFLLKAVPADTRPRFDLAGKRAFASLVGYARATILVAVIDAVGIGIGLVAVGAPLVVPLTTLVFLSAFIPIAGAVVSGALAVLVVLVTEGWLKAVILAGVVLLVQQLEGNVLQPLIMGKAAQLHALPVVLAVAAGTVLLGITGAILAVPMLAMASAAVRSFVNDRDTDSGTVEADDPHDARPPPDDRPGPDQDPPAALASGAT